MRGLDYAHLPRRLKHPRRKLDPVIRYAGQRLPKTPSIAVLANDAIGNFVMATPLLRLLRAEHSPRALDYFGGTRTWELQVASELTDNSYQLHGATRSEIVQLLAARGGSYDLIVNLESTPFSKTIASLLSDSTTFVAGPSAGAGGRGDLPYADDDRGALWADKCWIASDLTSRFPFLRSGFIAEIFARLCYLEGELPGYEVPSSEPGRIVPDILIAASASLDDKLWTAAKWQSTIRMAERHGLSVGLLGAKPSEQRHFWKGSDAEEILVAKSMVEDLRGQMSLPQVVGALALAKAVVTLDNGVLHLAVAAGTSTVGLYREGIHRLWAPPAKNLAVLTPRPGDHVSTIAAERVWEAIERAL